MISVIARNNDDEMEYIKDYGTDNQKNLKDLCLLVERGNTRKTTKKIVTSFVTSTSKEAPQKESQTEPQNESTKEDITVPPMILESHKNGKNIHAWLLKNILTQKKFKGTGSCEIIFSKPISVIIPTSWRSPTYEWSFGKFARLPNWLTFEICIHKESATCKE